MEEPQLNIHQKLAQIRKSVEVMKRDTKAYGYSYTKEEDILARITVGMRKHNLSLIPEIVPGTLKATPHSYKKTKTTSKGDVYEENVNEILVSADMTWTWVNDVNPEEKVVVNWAVVGHQGDGSQSFGSGLTYSSRYFLLKFFNIATSNDDPDKFRSRQKEVEVAENKVITEEIIKNVDTYIKEYVAKNPGKRDEILTIVKKYVKSGDYNTIKEHALAAKLLQEVVAKTQEAPSENN